MSATPSQKRPIGRRLGEEEVSQGGSTRSFTGRFPSWDCTVSIVDVDRRHARGGDTIDQAISFLQPVTGPIAGDVDLIVANFDGQVRDGGIEVEQPRHVGLGFGRDAMQAVPGHHKLPGPRAIIALFDRRGLGHGIGHPVMDLALALVAKQ